MKYTHIHVAKICRTINEYLGAHGHALPAFGEESQRSIASTVRELLEEETVLADMLEDQYYETTRSFGCPTVFHVLPIYMELGEHRGNDSKGRLL